MEPVLTRNLKSLDAAADYLDVSVRTVRRWIDEGKLHAVRVGPRLIKVDQAELDALLQPLPARTA